MGDYQQMGDAPAGPLPPPFALSKLDSDKEGLLKGLTDAEVAELVKKYGLNEVPEEKEPLWKMFLKQFTGPMQIMIECAALLCFLIHNWPDFTIIMVLLMTNGTLGFFEEKSAQASVDALKAGLEKKMPVKRNGKFDSIPVVQVRHPPSPSIQYPLIIGSSVSFLPTLYIIRSHDALLHSHFRNPQVVWLIPI